MLSRYGTDLFSSLFCAFYLEDTRNNPAQKLDVWLSVRSEIFKTVAQDFSTSFAAQL